MQFLLQIALLCGALPYHLLAQKTISCSSSVSASSICYVSAVSGIQRFPCRNRHWYCPIPSGAVQESIRCMLINGSIGSDCIDNQDCQSRVCDSSTKKCIRSSKGLCDAHDQCAEGQYCNGESCESKKQEGENCENNGYCASEQCRPKGTCSPKLADNGICLSGAHQCTSRFCTSIRCRSISTVACTTKANCPFTNNYCNGQVCEFLKAVGANCDSNPECESAICVNSVCQNPSYATCSNSLDCPNSSQQCINRICTVPKFRGFTCATQTDCFADYFYCSYTTKLCVDRSATTCEANDYECAAGRRCRAKQCIQRTISATSSCHGDDECPSGQYCKVQKTCHTGLIPIDDLSQLCEQPAHCAEPTRLQNVCTRLHNNQGFCQNISDTCNSDAHCSVTQKCDTNFQRCVERGSIALTEPANSPASCTSNYIGQFSQNAQKCTDLKVYSADLLQERAYPYTCASDSDCVRKEAGFMNATGTDTCYSSGSELFCANNPILTIGANQFIKAERAKIPVMAQYALSNSSSEIINAASLNGTFYLASLAYAELLPFANMSGAWGCLKHDDRVARRGLFDYDFEGNRAQIEANLIYEYFQLEQSKTAETRLRFIVFIFLFLVLVVIGLALVYLMVVYNTRRKVRYLEGLSVLEEDQEQEEVEEEENPVAKRERLIRQIKQLEDENYREKEDDAQPDNMFED